MGLDYVNQLGKATPEKNLQNLQKVQKGLLKVLKVLFLVIQLRQAKRTFKTFKRYKRGFEGFEGSFFSDTITANKNRSTSNRGETGRADCAGVQTDKGPFRRRVYRGGIYII